ncbi:STM3941 family protein [Sphingobacterium athyrii]|uniref:Uncharacterized protein n=1 Tax=Sphingobacterium athyrii TaxID=2152717 RepID=A0A363NXA3_9SPHI|nr:STM3941 family protein [Sphingobacterium athyrii]PUV25348.1 hypothetical protein DCO56_10525 [Sphingobacterium athyrii]
MNEIIIEFDNKKRLKLVCLGVVFTVAALAFAYYIFFVAEKIRIAHGTMMLMLGCLGIYFIIVGLKSLFDKDRTGLILNSDGIHFKGTPLGKAIGLIKWNAVQSVSEGIAHRSPFVSLKLQNPEDHIQNLSSQLQQFVISNGIAVTADQLAVDFNELKSLIADYHQRYRQ